jgi:hypothetical protein
MPNENDRATRDAGPLQIAPSIFGRGLRLGKLFGFDVMLDFSLLLVFGLVLLNLALGLLPAWHPNWTGGLQWLVAWCAAVLFFAPFCCMSYLMHGSPARSVRPSAALPCSCSAAWLI